MKNAWWQKQEDGRQNTGDGLRLRPRDMLKIGQLVLDRGIWNDQQLINGEWIDESTAEHLDMAYHISGSRYGYYWWNKTYYHEGKEYKAIEAFGWGDQRIVILPKLNMVVVTTAYNFNVKSFTPVDPINHIIPAFL